MTLAAVLSFCSLFLRATSAGIVLQEEKDGNLLVAQRERFSLLVAAAQQSVTNSQRNQVVNNSCPNWLKNVPVSARPACLRRRPPAPFYSAQAPKSHGAPQPKHHKTKETAHLL